MCLFVTDNIPPNRKWSTGKVFLQGKISRTQKYCLRGITSSLGLHVLCNPCFWVHNPGVCSYSSVFIESGFSQTYISFLVLQTISALSFSDFWMMEFSCCQSSLRWCAFCFIHVGHPLRLNRWNVFFWRDFHRFQSSITKFTVFKACTPCRSGR